jgi:hypothetical protein
MAESLDYASPRAAPEKSGMARGVVMFVIVRSAGFWLYSMANGGPGIFADAGLLAMMVGCLLVSPGVGFAAAFWILRPQGPRARPRVMGLAAGSALLSYIGSLLWPSLFWRALSPAYLDGRVVMIYLCAEFFVGFLAGSFVLGVYRIWFDRGLP